MQHLFETVVAKGSYKQVFNWIIITSLTDDFPPHSLKLSNAYIIRGRMFNFEKKFPMATF